MPRLLSMDAMAHMLRVLRIQYQGADGYLKSQCGLSECDITTIKENLLTHMAHSLDPSY